MTTATMPTRPGTYMRRAPGWENAGWTAGPNALFHDRLVEWDAKGAYMWVASHQELIFQLDAEQLAAAGPRGRNHAYEMLRHLEYHGWLTRSRYRATDGRGTVHIWDIQPAPVAVEERSWKPSKAEIRAGYTAPDGTKMPPLNPDTLTAVAPELPDGRKFRKSDLVADETPGETGTPGRSGTPAPEPPGNLDRPGTDRPGFPYMEDKTIQEENPPNPPRGGGNDVPPTDAKPPIPRCEAHGIARCRQCGLSARSAAQAERERTAAQLMAAERAGRACAMCAADGPRPDGQGTRWIRVRPGRRPGTQATITPYVMCDHETPLDVVLAELAAVETEAEAARAAAAAADPARPGRTISYDEIRAMAAPPGRAGSDRASGPPVSTGKDGQEAAPSVAVEGATCEEVETVGA